jgi:transposase
MLVVGIDVGAEVHQVAVIDATEAVIVKPTPFAEDAAGYQQLFELLARAGARGGEDLPLAPASAPPQRTLVVMEATGHYWQNLFAALVAEDYAVALVNPLRTHRFAGEELARTKTDSIDCLQIARFGAQKRPAPTALPDAAAAELRELVRLRMRLLQEGIDRVNQLHRLIDLGFPEFTRYFGDLNTELAGAILRQYPTAQAFRALAPRRLARLNYDGRHKVGEELARKLIDAAKISVGSQHSPAHQTGVRYACEDLQTLRKRLKQLAAEISSKLEQHQVGKLLTTIAGIGDNTAAMLIAELGDPARFESAGALAAYVGLCPGHRHSGKHQPRSSALTPIGNRRVRKALWMPTLGAATQSNPWLMTFYRRLIARGKPSKVALIAAMRKLLNAIYSVAKNRRPFVPFLNAQPTVHPEAQPSL